MRVAHLHTDLLLRLDDELEVAARVLHAVGGKLGCHQLGGLDQLA